MTTPDWDATYAADTPAPWDIGRPQQAFVRLADDGMLSGRLLDVGCGTGEHALLAAAHGADAVGVDISPRAIGRARDKAAARSLAVRFEVADVLTLDQLGLTVDTVIDSGLFHVLDDAARTHYVVALHAALRPGGHLHLMCFSDRQPGDWGPHRITEGELRAAFGAGWRIDALTPNRFDIDPGLALLPPKPG
jgi:SAM-dependent methyltransferase